MLCRQEGGGVSHDALFAMLNFVSSNHLEKYVALQDSKTLANTIITRVSCSFLFHNQM